MDRFEEIGGRIEMVKQLIADHLLKKPYVNSSMERQAWNRRIKQLLHQLNDLGEKQKSVGSGSEVIRVSGEFKINKTGTKNSTIWVKKKFTVYYQGINSETAIKLLNKKLNFIDFKTIKIITLKLGELYIN